MDTLFSRRIVAALVVSALNAPLCAAPPVALTADVGGHVGPCLTCPESTGLGGLVGRTAAGQSVEGVNTPLRLDAGGFLFGDAEPSYFVEAFAAADLDAINLAMVDFRLGLEYTRDRVVDAGLPVTSANLCDVDGQPLFAPFLVAERGGHKAAIIGITEPPAALAYLPHLQDQLAGITIIDPIRAVADILPAAEQAADTIVLLIYGSARTVEELRRTFGERIDLIGVGGDSTWGSGQRAFESPGPVVLLSKPHGTHVTVYAAGMVEPQQIPVSQELRADQAVQAVLEKEAEKRREQAKAMQPRPPTSLPASGAVVRVLGLDTNQGLGLTIYEWRTEDSWQGTRASENSRFLIVDMAIKNQLHPRLSQELEYADAVQVASLRKKSFLVMNGRRIIRHPVGSDRFSGHLPDSFVMSTPGRAAEGQVVFEIPDKGVNELDLVLYHDEFPSLKVTLLGDEEQDDEAEAPVARGENEVMTLELHSVTKTPSPREGFQRLVLDIRGRSNMSRKADSAAMDATVPIAENRPVDHAIPLDYSYFSDLMVLELPEERSISPTMHKSEFPDLPAFLPDRMAGGRLVFEVPDEFAEHALRLKAWFPTMILAGDGVGVPVNPGAISLEVQPGRELRNPAARVSFPDGDLTLDLLAIEAIGDIAGHDAPEGHQWVRTLLRLENSGGESGLMPMAERFGLRRDRERITFETSGPVLSPFHPPSRFYLPAGEARVFEVVFKVPLDWPEAYFDYRGVTSNPGRLIDFESADLIADQKSVVFESDPDTESGPELLLQQPGKEPPLRQGGGFDLATYSMSEAEPVIEFTPAIYSKTLESTPPESRIELGVTAENERLRITASHAYVFARTEVGELPEEGKMVGVHLRIERRENASEPVPIRFLNQHLFGVSGLSKFHHLHSDTSLESQISHRFELKDGTPFVEGFVLFKLNASRLSHFELHWVDEEFGNFGLPIFPVGKGWIESPDAAFTGQNAIAEFGVYGMEFRDSYRDQPVENGRWLVLDLRGRSVRKTAETAGGGGGVGARLSWRDWMLRTQLIVNGDQIFDLNRHRTELEEPFLMLPGRSLGGEIAFEVPDDVLASAESIEWVAGFGAYANPGFRVGTPEPIRLQLKGERSKVSLPEKSLVHIEDEDFDLYVVRVEKFDSFRGQQTRGQKWIVAEGVAQAKAEAGVSFHPLKVLQLVNPNFEYMNPTTIVWGGSDRQESRDSSQWIAQGDVRRFQMAWRLRSDQTPYRLRYRGMRHYQMIPLGEDFALEGDKDPVDPEENRHISEKGLRVLYPDRIPEGIAGVGLEPQQVNAAIDRGQSYLWKEIQEVVAGRGRVAGMTYIYPMLYALVNTDLHVENEEFDKVLREFLDQVRPQERTIYENGLLAMILRAYGDPDYAETLKQTVHYLVEAQGENGTWSYRAETPDRFFVREEPVESADGLLISGGENPAAAAEKLEDPVYRTQSFTLGTEGDNSCTQFAVLGLWSAQRAGIKVDTDVWRRVLRSATDFQDYRNSDSFGGYAYRHSGNSYGSMTAAVLCTTALALRRLDPEVNVAEHLRIRNALGWLLRNFSVQINPEMKRYNYYYLYSLERVGQILGTEFIGNYEWYPLGARYLVDAQAHNGSWPEAPGETNTHLTTAYALLFLTRATPKMDEDLTPDPEEPGKLLTRLQRPELQNRVYLILDASGSMRDEMQGQEKFEVAREAVADMLESLPENTEVALRVYGHRLRAIENGADEDSELVIPWGQLDVPEFKQVLQALTPMGKTPLSLSLTQAAGEMTSRRTEGQSVVVLLTDGGESDRFADPVEAARTFADKEDVQFFVLGFDISREDWTRQLMDMAEAGKGLYRPVKDANLLTRELISVVHPPAPYFDFVSDTGESVESGRLDNREFSMKPGKYTLTLNPGAEELKQTVWIRPGGTTRIQYTLDPTRQRVRAEEAPVKRSEKPKSSRSAFCTQCGNSLDETTRFCTKCGARVTH